MTDESMIFGRNRRQYTYTMGFAVDGVPIPDPSGFKGMTSDLDTLGVRNMKGEVQRKMIATKHKVEFEYRHIEWSMVRQIGDLLNGKEFFQFTYPDAIAGVQTITAYVGDRNWDSVQNLTTRTWIGTLKFNIIEK